MVEGGLMFEVRGVDPGGGPVVGWNRGGGRVWVWGGEGSGIRRRFNSCRRKEISFTKAASLFFNWSSSDLNSCRIAEITAMGEASVFLLVAIVEPPRDVSSGIETISTGGGLEVV